MTLFVCQRIGFPALRDFFARRLDQIWAEVDNQLHRDQLTDLVFDPGVVLDHFGAWIEEFEQFN